MKKALILRRDLCFKAPKIKRDRQGDQPWMSSWYAKRRYMVQAELTVYIECFPGSGMMDAGYCLDRACDAHGAHRYRKVTVLKARSPGGIIRFLPDSADLIDRFLRPRP